MARNDKDKHRTNACTKVWRAGEQRSVVGECLKTVFPPVGCPVSHDFESLLRAIGPDRPNGQQGR